MITILQETKARINTFCEDRAKSHIKANTSTFLEDLQELGNFYHAEEDKLQKVYRKEVELICK